ncbi:attacin-A-like [Teleopsis dalmanni]|uniref:attacin-A-like n=1 Tax=Teleopsis dalmanni TaxID=139649 RepID=UPI0018CD9838|nr:attacin-A-like [Teleopsis dalmanni]
MNTILCIVLLGLSAVVNGQLSGSIAANPTNGGQDVNLMLSKSIGDAKTNVGGGLFANGNTNGGPLTTGGFLAANKDGHGLSLQHSKTPGFGSTFQQNAHVNLLDKNNHNLAANAFHSRTNLENGFKFDRVGGGLNYNHANGHGASLTASRIPQLNMNTVGLDAKANLWRSLDRQTSFDLTGGVSKNFGGPFNGQVNKNFGFGLTHNFG